MLASHWPDQAEPAEAVECVRTRPKQEGSRYLNSRLRREARRPRRVTRASSRESPRLISELLLVIQRLWRILRFGDVTSRLQGTPIGPLRFRHEYLVSDPDPEPLR